MGFRRAAAAALPSHAALVLFPAAWFACVGLAQIHVLEIQQPWSRLMWVVVLSVPVAYVLGALFGREVVAWLRLARREISTPDEEHRRLLRRLLLGCAVVGNLEEAHQFIAAGTVPLFSSHIDSARFALPGGPTIILTDLLMVAAIVSLVLPRRLLGREALPEILIASFALSGYVLAAGRGTVLQALTVAAITRWRRFGLPSARLLLLAGLAALVFAAGLFYVRTSQHANDALGVELRESVYPGLPRVVRPLVPIDLALATNLEALSRLVAYFPDGAPHGHGAFVAHGFDLFIHSARDVQEVSAQLSPPWVTSTVAGPFWADGGLPLVIAGLAAIGALVAAFDWLAQRTGELRFLLVGANFLFLALFGVYVNLWTQQVDWLLITLLLFAFGSAADGLRFLPKPVGAWIERRRVNLSTLRE